MDLGLKAHAKAFELQNQSISALSTKQSAVSKDVASLSQTLRSVAPQDDDRQQQIRQLQKNMLETQAQLARLQPLATATTVNVNAPRIKRKL
jgi:peptidoglycan hydrolase CwlO-like protein